MHTDGVRRRSYNAPVKPFDGLGSLIIIGERGSGGGGGGGGCESKDICGGSLMMIGESGSGGGGGGGESNLGDGSAVCWSCGFGAVGVGDATTADGGGGGGQSNSVRTYQHFLKPPCMYGSTCLRICTKETSAFCRSSCLERTLGIAKS